MAGTAHLTLVAPNNEKCTVQSAPARLPRRKPNAEYRSREHLTEREVGRLIEVVRGNRWGHRDATMVLIAFRHGLRAFGIRLTSKTRSCTSVNSRMAALPPTH
jgi:hypothetical protein